MISYQYLNHGLTVINAYFKIQILKILMAVVLIYYTILSLYRSKPNHISIGLYMFPFSKADRICSFIIINSLFLLLKTEIFFNFHL